MRFNGIIFFIVLGMLSASAMTPAQAASPGGRNFVSERVVTIGGEQYVAGAGLCGADWGHITPFVDYDWPDKLKAAFSDRRFER